jgi:hypothetical protein
MLCSPEESNVVCVSRSSADNPQPAWLETLEGCIYTFDQPLDRKISLVKDIHGPQHVEAWVVFEDGARADPKPRVSLAKGIRFGMNARDPVDCIFARAASRRRSGHRYGSREFK